MTKIIALITDFGLEDIYVGVMKGVIAQINPNISTIDITHQIPPQNLLAANFALVNACNYFPDSTIYLGVIDPGVGNRRRSLACRCGGNNYLIGPDNGLFTGIMERLGLIEAIELNNSQYWLNSEPSYTFHGRDIFAPVAAHLANGILFTKLGSKIPVDSLVKLPLLNHKLTADGVEGVIQHIDHFGNLISNIPQAIVWEKSWFVIVNEIRVNYQKTYSQVVEGELLALVSSNGWVEIALNGGSAQQKLKLNIGDKIIVKFE